MLAMTVNDRNLLASVQPPPQAVLATWNLASTGYGAGMHYFSGGDPTVLQEFGIYLCNEAWYPGSSSGRWAEFSLSLAEEFLTNEFDLPAYDLGPTCSNGQQDDLLGELGIDCGGVCPKCDEPVTNPPTSSPTTTLSPSVSTSPTAYPTKNPSKGPTPSPVESECGNGTCNVGESCDGRSETVSCPADCASRLSGNPSKRFCYVDGECQGRGCPVF